MTPRTPLVVAVAALAVFGTPASAVTRVVAKPPPVPAQAVIALIDTGVNPYNVAFRDRSPLAFKHPSSYLPGYPKATPALKLSLNLPYDKAVARDAAVWEDVEPNTLYWIPGTRFVGVMSIGEGGGNCPAISPIPPANILQRADCAERPILDDHGHGSMTASRAAGAGHSLAPNARIVAIEGLDGSAVRWAADAGWIDVQTNSWLSLIPQPAEQAVGGTTEAFAYAAEKMLTLAASGNGAAYATGFAPTPTYTLSTAAPGVVLVGGHDNGRMTPWAGSPAHVVADAYGGWAAVSTSSTDIKPDPIACCTSAASPYAAGGAAAIVLEARRLLGHRGTGIRGGVVARGRAGVIKAGPLADGVFTLEELHSLFLHSAEALPAEGRDDGLLHWAGEPRAPDYTQFGPGANPFCQGCTTTPVRWTSVPASMETYPYVGYGAINERSVALAAKGLRGEPLPARAVADQLYIQDQAVRSVLPHG